MILDDHTCMLKLAVNSNPVIHSCYVARKGFINESIIRILCLNTTHSHKHTHITHYIQDGNPLQKQPLVAWSNLIASMHLM